MVVQKGLSVEEPNLEIKGCIWVQFAKFFITAIAGLWIEAPVCHAWVLIGSEEVVTNFVRNS